jgi:membrane associated rhomboid family serine protease
MFTTYIIIGITVAISLYAFNNHNVYHDLMMNPYQISTRNQYYRFFSSGFIHGSHMHLIMNMISLYFFGIMVEIIFYNEFGSSGTLYFILLYIMGIVVSDIPTYFKHTHDPGYNSLGASGGVASVIFAFILFRPLENISLYFFIPIKGFILGVMYVVYSYYQGKKSGDNINHDAHLYGALFGLLFCIVMRPSAVPEFFQQIASWQIFE